jgi:hypothetical protein
MTSFKLRVEGLDEIKRSFKADSSIEKILPNVTLAMLKFNNVLEQRIEELYNAPGSLSDVMIGHSIRPEELSKTFLRYSLQYRDKPIRLIEYPSSQSGILPVLSKAPLRKEPLGPVHWKQGRYSRKITVNKRKDKPEGARLGGNFSKRTAFYGFDKRGIFARETDKTWSELPKTGSYGKRAPFKELYGPSLMTLANALYDKDSKVKRAVTTLEEDIIKAMVSFYD